MVTSEDCFKKYGEPSATNPCMVLWDVPKHLETGLIPNRIFCNKDFIGPASKAFKNLIDRGFVNEIKTYDGCFNVRKIRGGRKMSLHSWGIAIDFNAFSNPLGLNRSQIIAKSLTPLSEGFLKCFKDAGFDCGADWKRRPDFMHFQLAKI
jgi:hypothetical protein